MFIPNIICYDNAVSQENLRFQKVDALTIFFVEIFVIHALACTRKKNQLCPSSAAVSFLNFMPQGTYQINWHSLLCMDLETHGFDNLQ